MSNTKRRRILRWFLGIFLLLVLLASTGVVTLWWLLRASVSQLDGVRELPGLNASVIVERDQLGVPTVNATNRLDASRALGFLHAQERFFQMDLSRRAGAGELSELFGSLALTRDQQQRIHRPRARARKALEQTGTVESAILRAYAEGVNAGLEALRVRPPEYLALRAIPSPWQPEDTFLVAYTMFGELHDLDGQHDYKSLVLHKALGPAALAFFNSPDTLWEAALDSSKLPPARLPTPEEFTASVSPKAAASDPIKQFPPSHSDDQLSEEEGTVGSNNWAVDGHRSGTGSAIVANDMHLGLRVPNTWYRARLRYPEPELGPQDVTGVTLPGTPVVVAGSNRHVAWANTFSCVDITDLVVLELEPTNAHRYRTPEGWREMEKYQEHIKVRGAQEVKLDIFETIWGPLVEKGHIAYALACAMHDPGAVNLGLLEIERATSAEKALRLANLTGTPVNNFVVGDDHGHIGYSLLGRLPNRVGFTGEIPRNWSDGKSRWEGWVSTENYPLILDPTNGIVWTANNRILGSLQYTRFHISAPDNGARAQQIRDDLSALSTSTEQTLWSVYKDDRALFLARWQKLLLSTLETRANPDSRWREARDYVTNWGARASVESQGYRLVRSFRTRALELLFEPVNQRLAQFDSEIQIQSETAAWAMLDAKPKHLLNPRFSSFEELLTHAVEQVLSESTSQGSSLAQATWGNFNQLTIQHPLSRAIPQLSRWLNMPVLPISGDKYMPKVGSPKHGVSERLIVSPGHEENALFNMPCGQSGHFLSPFYRGEMDAWLKVEPQPFLPQKTKYHLELRPK